MTSEHATVCVGSRQVRYEGCCCSVYFSIQTTRRTRSSSAVTLARPSVSSSYHQPLFQICITLPVESSPLFIPSTSFCSLSSWFTSSCAYHLITVTIFALTIYHSLPPHLKLISSTNSFLHSLSGSIWIAFKDLQLGLDLLSTNILSSFLEIFFVFGYMRQAILITPPAFHSHHMISCCIISYHITVMLPTTLPEQSSQSQQVSVSRVCHGVISDPKETLTVPLDLDHDDFSGRVMITMG